MQSEIAAVDHSEDNCRYEPNLAMFERRFPYFWCEQLRKFLDDIDIQATASVNTTEGEMQDRDESM